MVCGNGQWNKAIPALESALKKYPTHKEAPFARQRLIECYVVKKEYEKADKERESLVKDYGAGSKWYSANSNDKVVIDKVKSELENSRK